MTNVVTPQSFSYTEDAFLEFVQGQGYPTGREDQAREDVAYRKAITGTSSWRRNAFDIYFVMPSPVGLVHADVKAVTDTNSGTGNASIEIRPIIVAATKYDEPALFVHYPDWAWLTPGGIINARTGGCCADCFDALRSMEWGRVPEKCPNRWWRGGSGDPWVKFPVSKMLPWDRLLDFLAWKRQYP